MVSEWPAEHVAVAVVAADGTSLGTEGPQDREFRLASVTKLLSAYAVLIAVEEGGVEWDQPAGPPGAGAIATCADLARFAAELQRPRLVAEQTLHEATRETAFPGLDGVLPGFGRQRPNDWGLGFEIRGSKSPHWTGAHSSPETFG